MADLQLVFESLQHPFFQRALIASLIVSLLCSLISFFVVLRKMAFIGSGIAHVAFGGVALALALGLSPLLGASCFAVIAALWIVRQRKHNDLAEDTAIGIAFAAAMGFGVICASLGEARNADLMTYLFGNVLTVSTADIVALSLLATIVLVIFGLNFRKLLFISFDEEVARVSGIHVDRLNALLFTLVALTIVLAIRTVGLLLVAAFLVIPGAVAQHSCRTLKAFLLVSLGVGGGSAILGLFLSLLADLPSGACMVIVASIFFAFSRVLHPHRC